MAEIRHPTDMTGSPSLIQQMAGVPSPFVVDEASTAYINVPVDVPVLDDVGPEDIMTDGEGRWYPGLCKDH